MESHGLVSLKEGAVCIKQTAALGTHVGNKGILDWESGPWMKALTLPLSLQGFWLKKKLNKRSHIFPFIYLELWTGVMANRITTWWLKRTLEITELPPPTAALERDEFAFSLCMDERWGLVKGWFRAQPTNEPALPPVSFLLPLSDQSRDLSRTLWKSPWCPFPAATHRSEKYLHSVLCEIVSCHKEVKKWHKVSIHDFWETKCESPQMRILKGCLSVSGKHLVVISWQDFSSPSFMGGCSRALSGSARPEGPRRPLRAIIIAPGPLRHLGDGAKAL